MKSEDRKSRSEVADFLKEIALKLDSGSLTFRQGSEELVFSIPDTLTLELKLEEKNRQPPRIQFEIELEWIKDGQSSGTIEIL
jgi:amphi-Trp domain-containing protein